MQDSDFPKGTKWVAYSLISLYICGQMRSCEKLKTLHLHYHKAYCHKTYQGDDTTWRSTTPKVQLEKILSCMRLIFRKLCGFLFMFSTGITPSSALLLSPLSIIFFVFIHSF